MDKSIAILGGGTAGYVSALILKKQFPQFKVKIIKSEEVGIVGVGEGTTEHWKIFCDLLDINLNEFIIHCDSTFKFGILFDGWSSNKFLHSVTEEFSSTKNNYYAKLSYLILNNKILHHSYFLDNFTTDFNRPNQLHFDTHKLNYFLDFKSKELGIEIVSDNILDVELCKSGNISCLVSKKMKYYADIFLDCSGFSRFLLHKNLNIKWISYSKYLPLNSAFTFLTEKGADYNLWTKATAHKNGWSWSIPTQSRTGNGYVFCDKFTSIDNAKREMDLYYKKDLTVGKVFKFDPGRLEKFWHKNCISIGLSSNFVEPLEATSIGSIIQQVRCLCEYLPSEDSSKYNDLMTEMFDNIVDFIQAHYLTQREDSNFWKEIKYKFLLTDTLKENLSLWKNRMPKNGENISIWNLFNPINYIHILNGLNYFNKKNLLKEYEYYKNDLIEKQIEKDIFELENQFPKIKHKLLIENIKKNEMNLNPNFKYS